MSELDPVDHRAILCSDNGALYCTVLELPLPPGTSTELASNADLNVQSRNHLNPYTLEIMTWYYSSDGKTIEGPVGENEIRALVANGLLALHHHVVPVGERDWRMVGIAFPHPPTVHSNPPPLPKVVQPPPVPTNDSKISWFSRLGTLGRIAVIGIACFLTLAVLGSLAGPDKSKLREELAQIDAEWHQLQMAAASLESRISAGEAEMLKGLLGMGTGLSADRGDLTWSGVDSLARGAVDVDHADMKLRELEARARQLLKRRGEIVNQLR